MLLEEIVRRNRRRMLPLTSVATFNYWVVVSFLVGFFGWGMFFKIERDADVSFRLVVASSAAVGAIVAVGVIMSRLRSIRPRTVRRLGAVEVAPGEFPVLDNLLAGLALALGAAPVRAALLADDAPNALAIGRHPGDTTLVVTSGLIEKLTRDELEAVLAAELWAVRRLDTALQTVVLVCTGYTVAAHHFLREGWKDPRSWPLIALTWPTMAMAELVRTWALRSCDFGADRMAVRTTRNPEALRRALGKLRDDQSMGLRARPKQRPALVRAAATR